MYHKHHHLTSVRNISANSPREARAAGADTDAQTPGRPAHSQRTSPALGCSSTAEQSTRHPHAVRQ